MQVVYPSEDLRRQYFRLFICDCLLLDGLVDLFEEVKALRQRLEVLTKGLVIPKLIFVPKSKEEST